MISSEAGRSERRNTARTSVLIFKQSSPQSQPDWAGLMAATLVAALPMLILFMIFGKRIVNSIGFSGIK